MEVEKHEFIYMKMHMLEAEKLKMILEEIGYSEMPDWAKKKATEFLKGLVDKGVN